MYTQEKDEFRTSRFWVIVEAALEYFIAILTSGAYLARITKTLEFSDSLTGILSAFVSLGCIFQLGSSYVFRGAKRVKSRAILFQMINEIVFVFVYVTPILPVDKSVKTAAFLVCFISCHILINLIRSEKTNWHLNILDQRKRGIFSAKKEIVSLIGGMLFTYTMGSVIDSMEARGNIRGAFIVCAAAIFTLTVTHGVSLMLIKEKQMNVSRKNAGIGNMFRAAKDRRLQKAILVGVMWNIASYASTPFYGAYQIQELNFSMRFISVIGIVYGVVRSLVSPYTGRYADRHSFSKLIYLCFMAACAGFLVNVFTRPENGRVLFILYNVFSAVSMAGINSALVNIIYDFAPYDRRSDALALNYAVCGVVGFLTTCLVSPLVSRIQNNGNMLFGISVYPAQVLSLISVLVTLVLIVYMKTVVLAETEK